jgi:hypothetical protein
MGCFIVFKGVFKCFRVFHSVQEVLMGFLGVLKVGW